jgi:hypothetical protein
MLASQTAEQRGRAAVPSEPFRHRRVREAPPMQSEYRRKSNNALGVLVLSLMFLLESALAHHKNPSPASPYFWTAFSLAAGASFVLFCWFRMKDAEDHR